MEILPSSLFENQPLSLQSLRFMNTSRSSSTNLRLEAHSAIANYIFSADIKTKIEGDVSAKNVALIKIICYPKII
jgi:hypothetical protein